MKKFHECYNTITPWWKIIRSEFKMNQNYTIFCPIKNYNIKCKWGTLNERGELTVFAGYEWGASGPTWDTKSTRRATCFHDLLYYMHSEGLFGNIDKRESRKLKDLADILMYSLMIEDGSWEWRAKAWYAAVSEFGDGHWIVK